MERAPCREMKGSRRAGLQNLTISRSEVVHLIF
jgi:hypothetical protein